MVFPVVFRKGGIQHAMKQPRESMPLKLHLKPHKHDSKQKTFGEKDLTGSH